jgi:HK97 family phage portal protein
MSVASWLLGKVNSLLFNRKVGVQGGFNVVNNRPPVYPDSDLQSFIDDGYCNNASVYSIISFIARKFGSIPVYEYKVKDEKISKQYKRYGSSLTPSVVQHAKLLHTKAYDEMASNTELGKLLKRPNPTQGADAFWVAAYSYFKICGEVFIWLNRGDIEGKNDLQADAMPVLEMYVLPPHKVQIVPDEMDLWGVSYYILEAEKQIPIRKSDIIHWKTFNPQFDGSVSRTHLRGFSALKAGLKVLTQDDDSTDAAVAQYQNGGAKAVMVEKTIRSYTPQQKTDLENVFRDKINNKAVKASVAALQGDWDLKQLGLSSVDMELLEGGKIAFIRLCNLFGVPPGLFLPGETYENQQWQMKQLVTNLIIPDWCSLRDELNRQLLPAFKITTQSTIDIDYTDMPELQQEIGKMVDALMKAWWFTPNQRLKMMNEEESTNPHMDEVWIPNNLVRIDDAAVNMDDIVNDLNSQGLNDYSGSGGSNGNGKVPAKSGGKKVPG